MPGRARRVSLIGRLLAGILAVATATMMGVGATTAIVAGPQRQPGAASTESLLSIQVGDCVLAAPASEKGRLEELARVARTLLPRIEQELGARAAAPYRITLIPPGPLIDPVVRAIDAEGPPWAAGFVNPAARAGAIRVAAADRYPYADLSSVLAHEATHMLLYDAAPSGLPRWFGEGVATGIERSWGMRDVLVYSSSVLTGRLPPLAELDAAFDAADDRARAAYAASFDFLLWTVKTYGRTVVRDIVRESRTRPFPEAWQAVTGVSLDRSEAAWRRGSLLLYRWVPALTGTTALWTGITLLALLAGARRRARSRRILEQWQAEDSPPPPDETVH